MPRSDSHADDPHDDPERSQVDARRTLLEQVGFLRALAADDGAPRSERLRAMELLASIAMLSDRGAQPVAKKHAAKKHATKKHAAKKHAAKKHEVGSSAAKQIGRGEPRRLGAGPAAPRRLGSGS